MDMNDLIGFQRAEYASAIRIQIGVLTAQILIAGLSCVAVFLAGDLVIYSATISALILTFLWMLLDVSLQKRRSQSDRARRAVVFMAGTGLALSSSLQEEIESSFSVRASTAERFKDPNYFSSKSDPGAQRLADIVEESAFWSRDLMWNSTRVAFFVFALSFAAVLACALAVYPFASATGSMGAARALCAFLTLLVSTGTMGALIAYFRAAQALDRILPRFEILQLQDFHLPDLLLVITDYYSIIERAPLFSPGLYGWRASALNSLWLRRTADRC